MRFILLLVLKGYYQLFHAFNTAINILTLYLNNVKFRSRPLISGRLIINNEGHCEFGKEVSFNSYTANITGSLNKTANIRIKKGAKLIVGDYSGFTNCVIWCDQEIRIGKYCKVGTNTIIRDTDSHSLDYLERRKIDDRGIKTEPVIIGNDVFIGGNSIILKGVFIGDRSVIAAGSIVTKSIPPDEIWGGNPAKFIRALARNSEQYLQYHNIVFI